MGVVKKVSSILIRSMEAFFYWWGTFVAKHPFIVISGCILVTVLCSLGMLNLRFEADINKMWIPKHSRHLENEAWVAKNWQGPGHRWNSVIFVSPTDLLTPEAFKEMFEFHTKVAEISILNQTFKSICRQLPIADIFANRRRRREVTTEATEIDYEQEYTDYEYYEDDDLALNAFKKGYANPYFDTGGDPYDKLPPRIYCDLLNSLNTKCFETSLLEIWKYQGQRIMQLTKKDILDAVNNLGRSPYFGYPDNYVNRLGNIVRDENGQVLTAKTASHVWMTTVNPLELAERDFFRVEIISADRVTLEWESRLIQLGLEHNKIWEERNVDIRIKVNAQRSFGDISSSTVFLDVPKMIGGYLLMFAYTTLMLGRLNRLEHRFYLTGAGLFAVLMGICIGVGLMSAANLFFTQLHGMLPFIALGIGIDDMFVILQSYYNLKKEEVEGKTVPERIGATMRHAGVAISVTSFTDVCAFAVGAISDLPGLETFCVASAFTIGSVYLLQASWFVSFMALDLYRIDAKRDGFLPCCIKYGEDFKPSKWSQKEYCNMFMAKFSKLLRFKLFKVLTIALTLTFAGIGIWGTLLIKQEFDPNRLLPENSYLKDWIETTREAYPKAGFNAFVYMGEFRPQEDVPKLDRLVNELQKLVPSGKVLTGVGGWWTSMKEYMKNSKNITDWRETLELDENGYNKNNFTALLNNFLFHKSGAWAKDNFVFEDLVSCGTDLPTIKATRISVTFATFNGPKEHVPAKGAVDLTVKKNMVTNTTFLTTTVFGAWETDEVIGFELWRNLGMATAAVAIITLFFLADFVLCIMVLVCVVLTLVNVIGFLNFWDITIDTLSCVNIVMAIGLCVDYSAHIAHAYETSIGSRTERAMSSLKIIGAAIMNGGITTFLALVVMASSNSHIFLTFFKVFLLTVLFGLFHGIVFLPVVLSIVGPRNCPLESEENLAANSNLEIQTISSSLSGSKATMNSEHPDYGGDLSNGSGPKLKFRRKLSIN